MRQAYALLSLCEEYGDGRVEAMCQSALAFDVVNVSKVAKMLKSAAKGAAPYRGQGGAAPAASLRTSIGAVRDKTLREEEHRGEEHEGGRLMATATPTLSPDLVDALKRLRLGRIAATLPERLVLADKQLEPHRRIESGLRRAVVSGGVVAT